MVLRYLDYQLCNSNIQQQTMQWQIQDSDPPVCVQDKKVLEKENGN